MFESMDTSIRFALLPKMDLASLDAERPNLTYFVNGMQMDEVSRIADPDYEQFLADVWVGIVLTLMVLSCVCCMCSCLLYHKFQQWKRSVIEGRRNNSNLENGQNFDSESLPSYTIVSGLPSYDEAIEQLRQVKDQSKSDLSVDVKTEESSTNEPWCPHTPPTPATRRLSVSELFQFYKTNTTVPSTTDAKT